MNDEQSTSARPNSDEANAALVTKFNQIRKKAEKILEPQKPWTEIKNIQWSNIPLTLDKPRFGVIEAPDIKNGLTLLVSDGLKNVETYQLEWVLWREAVLGYLCPRVRMVKESADIGHFASLRYGIINRKHRHRLQQIWESVSPSKDYGFYRYNPSIGFAFFDNVVDGTFLKRVIPWLNTFTDVAAPMTSATFTSALERWMFDYHRLLKPIELKVLQGLNNSLHLSQKELAERLGLRQSSLSRIMKILSEKHLLRFINIVNLPAIGLHPIAVTFEVPTLQSYFALRKLIGNIRYTETIQEFNTIIRAGFTIPSRRLRRFRQWVQQLAGAWNLSLEKPQLTVERFQSRNFSLYDPKKGGWPLDYESILDNVHRLIKEEWTQHLPLLRSHKVSISPTSPVIKLQPEDFIYMQRATDAYILTRYVRSFEAHEARLAGFRESEHMAYRRRVEFLEEKDVLSSPIGIGLIHIGLDAIVNVLIEGTEEVTRRTLTAFQLFPHVASIQFDDGNGSAVLLVPKAAAVAIETSLRDILLDCGIQAMTAVKPAWEAYGWMIRAPVNSNNYNFEKGSWLWTKDTLPINQSPQS